MWRQQRNSFRCRSGQPVANQFSLPNWLPAAKQFSLPNWAACNEPVLAAEKADSSQTDLAD
jgi:hypothetical protein